MGGRKGGRKGGGKKGGGKGRKGRKGGSSGPRRLRRGDDVSLTDDEASDHMVIEDDESIDDEQAFGADDKDLKEMFNNLGDMKKKEELKGNKGKQQSKQDEKIYESDEDVDESDYTSSDDDGEAVNLSDLLDTDMKLTKRKTKTAKVIETKAESNFESSSLRTISIPTLSDLVGTTVDSESGKRLGKKMKKLAEKDHLLITTPEETSATASREREITKDAVSGELQKWNATIRHNRAKDFTSYPLAEPDAIPKPSTATIQDDSKPMTEMEKEIDSLLKSTGIREEKKELDSSAFMKLSSDVFGLVEDTTDDRSAMSKLKSVLSYEHEKKARVKKIKSKTYRRMVRKEKEKEKDKRLELLAIVDPEAALKKKKEEMLKLRAKERLNMKHRNKSQWIKHVKSMAKFDPETRAAVQNQNAIHQKLMMKMDENAENAAYNNDGGSDSDSTKSDEANEQEIDTLLTAEGSKSALWNLRKKIEDTTDSNKKLKGVAGMKFMQRNKDKEKENMLREVDQLEEDIDRYREGLEPLGENDKADSDSDSEEELAAKKKKKKSTKPAGKITFTGSDETGKDYYVNKGSAAVTDDHEGEEEPPTKGKKKKPIRKSTTKVDDAVELAVDTSDIATSVKDEKKKRLSIRKAAEQDEERVSSKKKRVTFSGVEDVQEMAEDQSEKRPKTETPVDAAQKKKKKRENAGILETDEGDMTMSQDYLIQRAFAGDGITEEFQKEKDADIDKDIVGIDANDALPGWGEWGGEDETLNEKSNARKSVLVEERKQKVEAARKKRKDAKLKNVIINENEDTLDPKYRLSKVPFPFRSPGHFVATLETPVGPDWNTETRTRKHIQGNMKTKSGTIITPIEKEQGTRKTPKMKRRKIGRKAAADNDSD